MDGDTIVDWGRIGFESLATIVAAFGGAWLAFKLEATRRRKDAYEQEVAAGNRALHTLYNMWNILKQFQNEIVVPCRDDPMRWLNMSASMTAGYGVTKFDLRELTFALRGQTPSRLMELLLEEQRFDLNADLIRQYRELQIGEVHPRMSNANIWPGHQLTENQIERILGPSVIHHLNEISDALIKVTDENVISFENTFANFRAALKEIHPRAKFISVQFRKPELTKQTN